MPALMKSIAAALIIGAAAFSPAGAGRAPTDKERASIETALREQGFVSWSEIERDDGIWEVDDARMQNGQVFDLELDAGDMRILTRDRED